MKKPIFWVLALSVFVAGTFAGFVSSNSVSDIDAILGEARSFVFHYEFSVDAVPVDARSVEAWVPVPQNNEHQTIGSIVVSEGLPYEIVNEDIHGNKFVRVDLTRHEGEKPRVVTVSYRVDRTPCMSLTSDRHSIRPTSSVRERYLEPNRLIPIEGAIVMEAIRVAGRTGDPLKRARELYDNIVATVDYDKSGEGWGRGDALYACDVRAGNCTDFHSLFIGEARSIGIPARFVMGFPVPNKDSKGTVGGYHCWAEFYVEDFGWVPIDASEAHKHPHKREALFGGLDADRVAVTVGRDIKIPGTDGEVFNYVIYPHVEVDGVSYKEVTTKFSYSTDNG